MNIRQIALSILDEYEAGGKYINLSLASHKADNLTREERAQLTALLYTAVERKLTYDYYISALSGRSQEDINPHTRNILRLGLCQLLDMTSMPDFAAVNETVKLARSKGESAFVNGILRCAARERDSLPMPPEEKNYKRYLSVKYSFPLGIVKHFDALYGRENAEKILEFYNTEKYTDITINTTKISVAEYLDMLEKSGVLALEYADFPHSIRIDSSVNPERLPGFSDGLFFVQDRASAVSSVALSPISDGVTVDVCSAPGGKSFAAAILSGDSGRIYSFDLHESKLSLIESGAKRLGLGSISACERDALTPDESLLGKADRVICDVPCSGLGVLGKKPDLRYRERSEGLASLGYEILQNSKKYLKTGGVLLYSTCTLSPDENEENVRRFLAAEPDFVPLAFSFSGGLESADGMLTLLPHKHGTDGFFMAKLKKIN